MYRFYLKQGAEQILLPVSPSEFRTKVGNSNRSVQILNWGEANILKSIGLRTFSFSVFLPGRAYSFVQSEGGFLEPIFFLNKFRQFKKSKKPVSLIIFRKLSDGTELFDGNVEVSFEDYEVREKAGEQGDFWVELRLKEYRKIVSAQYQAVQKNGKTEMIPLGKKRECKETPKIYAVQKGDSLWSIAKTMLNDGSKFKALAEKNGITNPNKIYPGQVLQMEV